MGVLTATIRYPGGDPAAKLNDGLTGTKNKRGVSGQHPMIAHFTHPRMHARGKPTKPISRSSPIDAFEPFKVATFFPLQCRGF